MSRPTAMFGASSEPSACFVAPPTKIFAPTLRSSALPGTYLRDRRAGRDDHFLLAVLVLDQQILAVLAGDGRGDIGVGHGAAGPAVPVRKPVGHDALLRIHEDVDGRTPSGVPSGCGIAETPMNVPSLMSASDALTIAETRIGSASFTVRFSPVRDLTESVLPSTLVISPRTRTGGRLLRPHRRGRHHQRKSRQAECASCHRLHIHSSLEIACRLMPAPLLKSNSPCRNKPQPAGHYSPILPRSVSTRARNCGVTSGRTPNQS